VMAVEVEIDVQVLTSEIKKTYASVSQDPEKDYIFPTGRSWARRPRLSGGARELVAPWSACCAVGP
jgi:hypothetical protein